MLSVTMLLSAAFAQDIAPPIVGGSETTDYVPVGTIVMAYNGSIYGSFCSGTLAAEDWVVTAAHCVEAAIDYDRQGYDIYFCTGSTLYTNRGIDECDIATDLIEHPQYDARYLEHDIGLLELSTGLRASGAYALNSTHPSSFSLDIPVTYVGWGITGDNSNDSGVKRTVEVPFYDNNGSVAYDSQYLYTWDPQGRKNICSGDSGGAALLYDNSAGWTLVGVNSHGFDLRGGSPDCEGDYAAAGIARVDAYYDWLGGYIGLEDGGDDGGNNGGGNNGGGNNGGGNNGGGNDDGGNDDGGDEPEDTGAFDTADPGSGNGNGNGNNNGGGKNDDAFGTCSSMPLRTGGLMGLMVLGAALVGRRQD